MKHFAAAVLILGIAAGCSLTPPATASAQITGWIGAGGDQFILSEIQDLPPWSVLHVFAPYTPTSSIQQKLGFEWPDAARFSVEASETIYLAVFVSGTNVVRVEEWARGRFDCNPALTERGLPPSSVIQIDRSRSVPTLTLPEPDAGASGSQPFSSDTKRASSAAGSRR